MNNSALSAAIAQRSNRAASPFAHATRDRLVDEMIDHYISWREECVLVEMSYGSWGRAEPSDQKLAFSAYVAALDREEFAAATYRRSAEQLASV